MARDQTENNRRSIRLKGYDYTSPGAYSVTVCTKEKECLFGKVDNGRLLLSGYGRATVKCWENIPEHFSSVILDSYIVMPNHVHGIVVIESEGVVGARHALLLPRQESSRRVSIPAAGSLPVIVGSFKSAVTRNINRLRAVSGVSVWQRNYYEYVIRGDEDLRRVREYIANNPIRWQEDEYNPEAKGRT